MSEALTEGSRYLATLDRDHRRANGVVYTPDAIVALVLDQEFGPGNGPSGPVLDPACGSGVFVTGVIARIAQRLAAQGVHIEVGRGRQKLLTELERLVWAVDVDATAVDVTLREARALIVRLAPGPLSTGYLSNNITVGDFLRPGPTPLDQLYRHVVGNPPYVPIDRIESDARIDYRQRFTSALGRVDLYYLFMERSVDVVRPGGSWTLITPDKFLSNNAARALRGYLSTRGSIATLSRFSSHSVFRDAATVPCITTWVHGRRSSAVQRRITLEPDSSPNITEERHVPSVEFQNSAWTFHTANAASLLTAISACHPRLSVHTTRISAGPATGLNAAFVIDAQTASALDDELVHPTVGGRDIGRFTIRHSGSMILVPYTWDANGEPSIIDLDDYPRTRRWLSKHRTLLLARHAVRKWGKPWWDLHDPITLPLHQTPKLLVPDVAKQNRFAVDDGTLVPQHSAYFLLPRGIDPDVLAAILNSEPVELAMRSTAPLVKDGFSRYRRQYLLDLPVPTATPTQAARIREAARSDTPEMAAVMAGELFNVNGAEVRAALDNLPR